MILQNINYQLINQLTNQQLINTGLSLKMNIVADKINQIYNIIIIYSPITYNKEKYKYKYATFNIKFHYILLFCKNQQKFPIAFY